MNIRSLTRGDGVVIGAAVLLLVFSFLPFFSFDDCNGDNCSVNVWNPAVFPVLPTVHLAAVIAAALIVAARMLPADRKPAGLGFEQWGIALSVFAAWAAIWSAASSLWYVPEGAEGAGQVGTLFKTIDKHTSLGYGGIVTLLLALVLAAAAIAGSRVPALKAPLLPAPRQRDPYGDHPQAGYGYPEQQLGQPGQPGPYGGQPQGGYGYPGGHAGPQPGQQQPGQQQAPQPGGPVAGGGAPDPGFQPFWFAVPVARPLFGEDGSPQPVAELAPGTWYLAIEQRGQALIAQTQDGRRGVLQDTSGIQRG